MHPIRSGRRAGTPSSDTRRGHVPWNLTGLFAGLALGTSAVLAVVLPTTASGSSPDVTVTSVPQFGNVLTTGGGLPLYTFASDHNGVSTCTGSCLQVWPPLTIAAGTSPTASATVPPGSLGAAVQSDGRNQVTWNGMPLYTFVSDTPGNATGNGAGGFALVPVTPVSPTTTTPTTMPTTTAPTTTVPGSPTTTAPRSSATTTTAGTAGAPKSGSGNSPSATSASGGANPATAPRQTSLAFTGAGDGLRRFAWAGTALAALGGLFLLFTSLAGRRSPADQATGVTGVPPVAAER